MTWIELFTIISVALATIANLFLAIYVYKTKPTERLNKTFLFFGLTIFLWCLTNLLALVDKSLIWIKLNYAIGAVTPISSIFFTSALSNVNIKKWLKRLLIILMIGVFSITLFTPLIVQQLSTATDFGSDADLGPLYDVWGVYMIAVIFIALYIPISRMRKVDEQRKKQISYFVIGATLYAVWTLTIGVILPSFGLQEYSYLDTPSTIFMLGFISVAIIKDNLMNVKSLFFQAFIYALVIISIIIVLLGMMFASSYFFTQMMIWPIYLIVTVTAIVLFFIGRLFFLEKRDLEKSKISLTESLKKSEESREIAETERDKTTTIIKSFGDGLIILDESGKIFLINPEAEKILEINFGKLIRMPIKALLDFPKAKPIVDTLKDGLKNISKKEVELAKDFIVELSVIPLNLEDNDIGHLIVIHDISREKTVEKMKTEFVSLAAHQLRTPLSIIKWSTSMLKNGDFGKLPAKQNEIVVRAYNNTQRLISLVNDLLDVTRIEEGKYLYEVAPADITEMVTGVMDLYKEETDKRKIKIEFKHADNLPKIIVDGEKIRLVIQNLIDNAIKYSPEANKILIDLTSNDKEIEFKIQDFGLGIPKDQQDRIFTKFFRSDNAVKVNTVGSGLGLYLAQNIIEAHKGKIWLESEEGKGTTFRFTLPIKKTEV